jgi:hypothetical protein
MKIRLNSLVYNVQTTEPNLLINLPKSPSVVHHDKTNTVYEVYPLKKKRKKSTITAPNLLNTHGLPLNCPTPSP